MEIIVCVKHVPETAEADLVIDESRKRIKTEDLVFDINEWDEYALEEAVLLKEKYGGSVTVITIGPEDADNTLRKCLAKGADKAIRVTDKAIEGSDGYAIAKILYNVVKDLRFDLILCGAQASDDGYAVVGVMLASLLGIPYATMVRKMEIGDGVAKVTRELEDGLEEIVEVKLPAVLTIQTGINKPRYASIMSIRRARQKEISVLDLKAVNLAEDEVGEKGSWVIVDELFVPVRKKKGEILSGDLDQVVSKIVEVMKERGVLK